MIDEAIEWALNPPMPSFPGAFRLGVAGSGFIVRECHLPSYLRAGISPVGIASRSSENARRVADEFKIERAYLSYRELIGDSSIDVLDVAVPPDVQAELIETACQSGSITAVLAQKPLAQDYARARQIVESCQRAGVILSVNQNMRYDQSVRLAKRLLETGFLGEPVLATIIMRGIPHYQSWQKDLGWVTLRTMSIHHLDCFRYWFGEPDCVFCSVRPDPRLDFPHSDGICAYILEYRNHLRCVSIDDTWTGPAQEGCPSEVQIEWRIEGTNGLAIGSLGWCLAPYTSPSTVRFARKGDRDFHRPRWEKSWFPDAFAGTMGQLLLALEQEKQPAISGHDNLKTMALVEAAYRSADEHRPVSPREIDPSLFPSVQESESMSRYEIRDH